MMTGISKFEEENYPEAKVSFTKVIDNKDNLFFEDAQWYLALCYLKTGEKDKAVNSLSVIKTIRKHLQQECTKNPEKNRLIGYMFKLRNVT